MAFWKDYLTPSWWNVLDDQEPRILQTAQQLQRPVLLPPGIGIIRECMPEDSKEIEILLRNYFTSESRCRMELPAAEIRAGLLRKDWWGIVARSETKGNLVGCIFSKGAQWKGLACGIVDFFCVSPEWRKKHLGHTILRVFVNLFAKRGRLVHFLLKEGAPLFCMPPVYQGYYIWRKSCGNPKTQRPGFVFQDLYHRSLPEGYRLGELVQIPEGAGAAACEEAVDASGFDIILMDSQFPHEKEKAWKNDTTYQWYCFNLHPGSFFWKEPPTLIQHADFPSSHK